MDIFNDGEEIYNIKESLALILDKPWKELTPAAQEMVNNICTAVKTRPAPVVLHFPASDLEKTQGLPAKMVVFGHSGPDFPLNKVTAGANSQMIATESAETLAGNPAGKKELWAAIQELLRTP